MECSLCVGHIRFGGALDRWDGHPCCKRWVGSSSSREEHNARSHALIYIMCYCITRRILSAFTSWDSSNRMPTGFVLDLPVTCNNFPISRFCIMVNKTYVDYLEPLPKRRLGFLKYWTLNLSFNPRLRSSIVTSFLWKRLGGAHNTVLPAST